jgi:ubiquinone/menaquinone biosynthesis C-methylase UbiE
MQYDNRVLEVTRKITKHLHKEDAVLDIGSGSCEVCSLLQEEGFDVTPVDVKNRSRVTSIEPIIYDGKTLPFADNQFDVSLLITVLHHTKNPEEIVKEARRVSKRIILMEDLHASTFQKYATFIMDSIYNNEYLGHPHSNKTEREWEEVFNNLGLKIIAREKNDWGHFFTSGTFYLEK